MARCEDWPCCGHEAGCCPDFDESGRQLNMKCTCGATVPLNSRYSICESCMSRGMDEDSSEEDFFEGREEDEGPIDDNRIVDDSGYERDERDLYYLEDLDYGTLED